MRKTGILFLFFFLIALLLLHCKNSETEQKNYFQKNKYKNHDPNVKYVGMTACRQCHYDKYESFIQTGMGKSFDKATKEKSSAKFDKHFVVYDKFSDLSYFPFWSEDSMKIMEFRIEGKDTVHKRIETVNYIIGSGQHTNSHIYNVNGYLHQMPLTFYTQKSTWDLPPGYENGGNIRFNRPIGLECMSCHNSLPDFTVGSENKYDDFTNGISCERCHGPGEIHVKEKTAGIIVDTSKEIDYSIVNPGKLSADLQFDVCQRCHLQGNTVLKEGKSFYDFKPGMKLSDIMTVFLPKYENADDEFIMASHADRLKMSKCFLESQKSKSDNLHPYKNSLTCVTCHNPHISVKSTEEKIFNTSCNKCHSQKTRSVCSEKNETRKQKQDNCISCHMPRSGSIDIPHVTVTDHFIRKPVKKKEADQIKKFITLVAVNEKHQAPQIIAEGYLNQYEKFGSSPGFLDSAKKYIPENSKKDIENNFTLLIRYYFLKQDYNKISTLVAYFTQEELLGSLNKKSWDNSNAWTCYRIGESFTSLGKADEAFSFYKKAAELAPFNFEFLNKLAGNLGSRNNIAEAKKIYEKIITENPKYAPAWCNLGFIYLQQGNTLKAKEYYNKAISLDPDYEQALINKAGLLIIEKKNSEAVSIAKRILKKNPKNEQALAIQIRFTK